jgi:acetylglutamate kinase
MIPKVRAALDAIAGGAKAARITNLDGLLNGGGTIIGGQGGGSLVVRKSNHPTT